MIDWSIAFLHPEFTQALMPLRFLFLDDDYVVERSGVTIIDGDIIGEGNFGDVYRGLFTEKNGDQIAVAVKACKNTADRSTTEKFLEEACMWMFL